VSGEVVSRPQRKHQCAPGWRLAPSGLHAIPPSAYDYPKGTVWQCECGQTWVSKGAPTPSSPGFCTWRREGRWERRRRERRENGSRDH
jgi:hypothetical protein